MTQTPAPHHADDAPPHEHPIVPGAAERRVVVRFGIALASVLFVAAAGVLYLRWATMRDPMCVFIVEAPQTLRGAEVSVGGINIAKPHTATIGRGERFAIPFYLDYGRYTVRVTMNDVAVVDTEVVLDHAKPYQKIDLKDVQPPPPQPATAAAATTSRSTDFAPAPETDPMRGLSSPSGGSGAP
jgi:hypothetical protein